MTKFKGHQHNNKQDAFGRVRTFTKMAIVGVAFGLTVLQLLPLMAQTGGCMMNPARDLMFRADIDNPSTLPDRLTLPVKNRTIALVHIGRTGGSRLKKNTAVSCMVDFNKGDNRRKACLKAIPWERKVAYQTRRYFHLSQYRENEMAESTSFLFHLRNPVDRIISAYQYSHPGNCKEEQGEGKDSTWSCLLKNGDLLENTGNMAYGLFGRCFSNPAMEDLAQASLSPYPSIPSFRAKNLTKYQRYQCRKLAVNLAQGAVALASQAAPHFQHNYEYYTQRTMWKYPSKEVLVVRHERAEEDLNELERLLGGTSNFTSHEIEDKGAKESTVTDSSISELAYEKLCCVLEHEIEIYKDILDKAANLDRYQKDETADHLKKLCGISKHSTWTQWRTECRSKLKDNLVAIMSEPKPTNPPTLPPTEGPLQGQQREEQQQSAMAGQEDEDGNTGKTEDTENGDDDPSAQSDKNDEPQQETGETQDAENGGDNSPNQDDNNDEPQQEEAGETQDAEKADNNPSAQSDNNDEPQQGAGETQDAENAGDAENDGDDSSAGSDNDDEPQQEAGETQDAENDGDDEDERQQEAGRGPEDAGNGDGSSAGVGGFQKEWVNDREKEE